MLFPLFKVCFNRVCLYRAYIQGRFLSGWLFFCGYISAAIKRLIAGIVKKEGNRKLNGILLYDLESGNLYVLKNIRTFSHYKIL